ncbi:MAG: nucleotidyltransferase family protein [Solirubrobacteraceae bacterium]
MTAPEQRPAVSRRRENALLFAVVGDAPGPAWDGATWAVLDWDYLARAAERQGIVPLLQAWLARRRTIAVPPAVGAQLYNAYWTNHFRNRILLQELADILRAAAAGGVAVMPLKGAVLAPCYYATPALRPMSDLDLLVRPADAEALAALLRGRGYAEPPDRPHVLDAPARDPLRRERAFVAERGGTPVLVEYRTEPLDPAIWQLTELDPTLTAILDRHAERMWSRGRCATLAEAPFVRPAPEDLLLHVASHLTTRHHDFRLLWLHDIAAIVAAHADAFDWDSFARATRALGLAAPVFAALEAAQRWLGAPLPLRRLQRALFGTIPGALAPLQAIERGLLTRRVRALDAADLAAEPPPDRWLKMAGLLRLRGPRPWLRALRWTLAPSRTYMRGWRGAPAAGGNAGYAAALALRLGLIGLRVLAVASRRLGLSALSARTERLVAWIHRATGLRPFAADATAPDNNRGTSGTSTDGGPAVPHDPRETPGPAQTAGRRGNEDRE